MSRGVPVRSMAVMACGVLAWSGSACSSAGGSATPEIIEVGAGASIQAAVDRAESGDLVLVGAGVYHEAVVIDRPGITLRGVDRNTVVLDGEDELDTGVLVLADGVTVENMTLHSYRTNGVLVSGLSGEPEDTSQLDGFRIGHVTAYNNGLYGLYAFQAGNGEIVDSYVSGHPDSGIYVGQCGTPSTADGDAFEPGDNEPCNVVVRAVTAELNALGYSGTNASQVWIVESVFRANRIGITPNSQSLEFRAPQTEAVVAGNLVVDNDDARAPEQASGGFGIGIAIGSGVANTVLRNRVTGHDGAGILITPLDRFTPTDNTVRQNVLLDNDLDLGFWLVGGDTSMHGNCFAENEFATASPTDIEEQMQCPASDDVVDAPVVLLTTSPRGPDYRQIAPPGAQVTMPGDVRAFAPAPGFVEPVLDDIAVPSP